MELSQIMEEMRRQCVRLTIGGRGTHQPAASRFGGAPDVPAGFEWPYYAGDSPFGGGVKSRPLSFLLQINCGETAAFDHSRLLPDHGLLSFFYEEESAPWGYDPAHRGCARVYWFENTDALSPADFPADLGEYYRNPELRVTAAAGESLPDPQDINLVHKLTNGQYDEYDEKYSPEPGLVHQLLGWPGIIQNNMTTQCELVSQGHYLGGAWADLPANAVVEAKATSLDKWQLLLQLDEVTDEDFCLSFGDGGRLYFYITRDDLKNRNFDNIWLIYQCC